jgi:hypothetical protein
MFKYLENMKKYVQKLKNKRLNFKNGLIRVALVPIRGDQIRKAMFARILSPPQRHLSNRLTGED